jgi:MFS family permease
VETTTRRGTLGTPFLLLFTASTASNLGDGVLLAAVPLLARQVSDDPLVVSSVTVAATLPWLVFGLAAGAVVDRHDRRRAMIVADVVRAAVLAAFALLAASGSPAFVAIIALVFVLGAAETVFDTAAQAILPALVPADRLERANGRLFGAQIASNGFVGPPLGALLFAVSASVPFGIDAATFAVSALLLARIPAGGRGPRPPGADGTQPAQATTLRQEVREGVAWLWRHAGVRAFAVGAAVVNLAHTAAMAVVVLLVRDRLHADDMAFGLALAGAAAGSIVGSHCASWLVERGGRRRAVLAAIGTFSTSLLCVGLAPTVATVPLVAAREAPCPGRGPMSAAAPTSSGTVDEPCEAGPPRRPRGPSRAGRQATRRSTTPTGSRSTAPTGGCRARSTCWSPAWWSSSSRQERSTMSNPGVLVDVVLDASTRVGACSRHRRQASLRGASGPGGRTRRRRDVGAGVGAR